MQTQVGEMPVTRALSGLCCAGEAPTGVLSKAEFAGLSQSMGIHDPLVTEMVFNAFDRNKDGSIDFAEFVQGMSIMTRGTKEEKAEFAFHMLDMERQGCAPVLSVARIAAGLPLASCACMIGSVCLPAVVSVCKYMCMHTLVKPNGLRLHMARWALEGLVQPLKRRWGTTVAAAAQGRGWRLQCVCQKAEVQMPLTADAGFTATA